MSDLPTKGKKKSKKKANESVKITVTINSTLLRKMMEEQLQLLEKGEGYYKLTDLVILKLEERYND